MNWFKLITELYQEFFREVGGNRYYVYRPSGNDLKMIARFMTWMRSTYGRTTLGPDLMVRYFEYQFSYYCRLDTRFGRGKVMINWVIGDKARKRWLERKKEFDFAVKYRLNESTAIRFNRQNLTVFRNARAEKNRSYLSNLQPHEEKAKQRFYNSDRGLAYCTAVTTLYNPKSIYCRGCNYAEQCEATLKESYPKIHTLRKL